LCIQDSARLQHQRPRQVQGYLLAAALSFLGLCFCCPLNNLPVNMSGCMCLHPEWTLTICEVLVPNTGSSLLGSVNVNYNASKL